MDAIDIEVGSLLTKYELWNELFEKYHFAYHGQSKVGYHLKPCKTCGEKQACSIYFDTTLLEWRCTGGDCAKGKCGWIGLIQHVQMSKGFSTTGRANIRILADAMRIVEAHEKKIGTDKAESEKRLKQYGIHRITKDKDAPKVVKEKPRKPVTKNQKSETGECKIWQQ